MTKQQKPRPSLEEIKGAVANVFNIEASNIDVSDRSHKHAHARGAVVLIARDIGITNQQIAESLSYRRAGSVSDLHSKAVTWRIENHEGFAKKVANVRGWLQRNGFNVTPQTNLEYRNG